MPEEYGQGLGGSVIVYSAQEIEEGLAKHQQLSKNLPNGGYILITGDAARGYGADVQAPDGADKRLDAENVPKLLEQVKAFLAEHPEPTDEDGEEDCEEETDEECEEDV